MVKVSIIILTKDRAELLKNALDSIRRQSFGNFEVVVVNDGSGDNTQGIIESSGFLNLKIIRHEKSLGITLSRREALASCAGEYVAILDDDDQWLDKDKLDKQVRYLDEHPEVVVVGGGIKIELGIMNYELRMRPQTDKQIRRTMLFRNNFFTSTIMFRKEAAVKAGGFVQTGDDLAEDYDLWLRMIKLGKGYNFQEVFTLYSKPEYSNEKTKKFFRKQLELINRYRADYPWYAFAKTVLKLRILL